VKDIWGYIQLVFIGIGGWVGWILGGYDGFLFTLIAFIVIDYLTGVMVAILEKKLFSNVGFRGIFKKVLIFTLVGVGSIIDEHLIKDGSAIRTAVIFFYLANEGVSIIENAGKIGLPIPKKLMEIFEQLNKESDGK
jgi:toxin secretion/phage lysis holin